MTEPAYVHVTALDERAKPYKRVWRCTAHNPPLYVKTHADRRDAGFGKLKWSMTGSLCDADGKVLRDENDKPLIHVDGHGLTVQTDAGIRRPDAEALLRELINDDGPETAQRVRRRARLIFAEPPTSDQIEARIGEDFEAELRFVVAKVERAALIARFGQAHGGKKPEAA